ncbi:tol-pal system protein YbgF [Profundibacterium mesophilum]|uniref:Cell division coordinator CpoB n=1 Tax=Profundibacterium mesophilum KAUST100406-0324 TaxID=1037889 RepID=A0A921TD50_9RHOB|nr:tol-pal system protein YbgF [Profundibacterium mesophilum]KAF0675747.1 Tetratricopeptide repeatdomain containing protein [Profundibacterium mesophilum KAUST100406-0324]
MRPFRYLPALALIAGLAAPASAQDNTATLADIRQDLSVLTTELAKLRRELSTTGGVGVNLAGTSALSRIDAMEAELQRLTAQNEQLGFRIEQIVRDGSNRIGDMQFRLCEIEPGCALSDLEDTVPLGGSASAAPAAAPASPITAEQQAGQLAVGEQRDFDRAKEALDSGSFRSAADLFATFTETYTGGPLSGEAHYLRGEALSGAEDDAGAARSYLESFSSYPEGPSAPQALLKLGLKLDALGQRTDACATLAEVPLRFAQSDAAIEAQTALASMGCQ